MKPFILISILLSLNGSPPTMHDKIPDLNVFGEKLQTCSMNPLTGYYRDGCCSTGETDRGTHTVCAVVTEKFLLFSKSRGNNLMDPNPTYGFPGLKPGDRWCLCASRWKEAWQAGAAPHVVLEATHERTIDFVPLDELVRWAWKADVSK